MCHVNAHGDHSCAGAKEYPDNMHAQLNGQRATATSTQNRMERSIETARA